MTAKKKVVKETPKEQPTQALVISEISLSERQMGIVNSETPKDLIKSKPGRGGKRVAYVEGGYVISRLNTAFSPLGWEFEITEKGETARKNETNAEGEVWVHGKITIIDHKNGYRVSKSQFGQHPIHKNVPIGDAYKAAATDALKKCASMLGIALDVYWGTLDTNENQKPPKLGKNELLERAKVMIRGVRTIDGLIAYDEKLKDSKNFTKEQANELRALIKDQVEKLQK